MLFLSIKKLVILSIFNAVYIFRRMKRVIESTVSKILDIKEKEGFKVVIAGLSNVYAHYITTYEEYQMQKYEGASTIFGPHTLNAYLDQYAYLTERLLKVHIHI